MKFKKLLKVSTILILINICTTASLESNSLESKSITTTQEEPIISVTTENFHRKQRQSRCIRCYEEGSNPESDPRYGNSRYGDDGGRNNRNRYYSSYPSKRVNYDDSNYWYNPSDRYDRNDDKSRYYENRYPDRYSNRNAERDRYAPNRYSDRYSDRYSSTGIRNDDPYRSRTYDHYDSRPPIDNSRYDSRPALYNNRGYEQGQDYRNRFTERERPYDRVRPGNYYNERNYESDPYDRHTPNVRDYDYDYRNYRPADEYHRDQDYNPGRGYSNNNLPSRFNSNNNNNIPYGHSSMSGHPYLPNSQSPPRPLQSENSSISSNHDNTSNYQNTRLQQDKNSNKGYAGDWNYANDRNKEGFNTDKDMANSSPYGGGGSRPYTGSYLFDRKSNNPMDLQNKNPSSTTEDKNLNIATTQNNNNNDTKNDEKNNISN